MSGNQSWQYQGRQEHGWFGDGTSPKSASGDGSGSQAAPNPLFDPANAGQRLDYAAHSIFMRVPSSERSRWTGAASSTIRLQLATSVAAWYGAAGLSRDAFRARFLDPSISDQTVDDLRSATKAIVEGGSYADLAKAGKDLAAAAQGIGVSRWSRFVSDSSQRAMAAVSRGEVPGVIKADAPGPSGAAVLGTLALVAPANASRATQTAAAEPQAKAGQPSPANPPFRLIATKLYPDTDTAALRPYTGPPLVRSGPTSSLPIQLLERP